MSEQEEVPLDEKINNTEIKIGKWSFTPAKLMILFTVVSSVLGGLYGSFEIYKDYMSMKEAIQTYVAPDLSAINERITKVEEKINSTVTLVDESTETVRDIRTDLKRDIGEIAKQVDEADRRNRELDRDIRTFVNDTERDMSGRLRTIERESESKLKELETKVDAKIQKAWENPLAK